MFAGQKPRRFYHSRMLGAFMIADMPVLSVANLFYNAFQHTIRDCRDSLRLPYLCMVTHIDQFELDYLLSYSEENQDVRMLVLYFSIYLILFLTGNHISGCWY